MIDALVAGHLATDPWTSETSGGIRYGAALVWAPVGGGHLSVTVVAFDADIVDELLTLSTGDAIAVVGQFTPGHVKPLDGESRFMADIVARALMTPYQVARYRAASKASRVDSPPCGEQFPPTKSGERP